MRDELGYSCTFRHMWKIKLHVCGVLLELFQQLFWGRAHNVVDLDNLIKFIISRKEREQCEHLEKDTADTP